MDNGLEAILAPSLAPLFLRPERVGMPSAWWAHVPFAFWLTSVSNPTTIVELGTYHGVSYAAFCEVVLSSGSPTRCYAVDTWQGDEHTGRYGDDVFNEFRVFHDQRYGSFSSLIRATFDEAVRQFEDATIDMLHIDGYHTYEAVKHDFETWRPKLSDRAVVLFHDSNVRDRDFGVWRFWSEISKEYPSFEFLHGFGLGVLAVGVHAPSAVRQLCALVTEADIVSIRERFQHIGAPWRLLHDAQSELASVGTREEAAAVERARLLDAVESARLETDRVRVEAEAAHLEADKVRAEAEKAKVELQEALARAKALSARVQSLRTSAEAADRITNQLAARAAERDAILASMTWRATAPLRSIVSRLSPRMHRGLRRAARIAWWAVTPLSLLRRLAVLREVDPYARWVCEYDTLTEGDRAAIHRHIDELARRPLISVIMPVYDTPERYLRESIESVLGQFYPDWELCIADDASTKPHVRQVLEQYRRQDSRIKVVYRAENGHISAASNSALELAAGEFVALLDHDDLLAPHALYAIADAINKHPDADLFYSDEDKIDAAGRRCDPYFKPDWNPELFYSQNFVSHLGVYRTSFIRALGGFRTGFEGSQDYDLALRVTAQTRGPVVHIPHILYHWRLFPGASTYSSIQLDKASAAARRAITEQLSSLGEHASVIESVGGYHRVIRQEPDRWPLVSVIISTRDHVDVLASCIEGLFEKTDYPGLEILIADNDSREPETKSFFENVQRRGVRIFPSPGQFNFSRINNAAAREAKGDILLFLNNDISMIDHSWLKEMIIYAMRPDVGAVGARLLYPDGAVQHAGVVLGLEGVAGHIHLGAARNDPGYFSRLKLVQDISCVTAACMAIRKAVFQQIGGFDEENLAVAFNDVDLCIRIREAGYRIIWTPHAELYHVESKSRGSDLVPSQLKRFRSEEEYMRRRWAKQLACDPFFNPNLSLEGQLPTPAFPPRHSKIWHVRKERVPDRPVTREEQLALIRSSSLFDRDWYLSRYPDVTAAALDPVEHYMSSGAAEGRDPGPNFHTQSYLTRYPDLAKKGINPLVHYIRETSPGPSSRY
jgi:GT2 family glycosyltransferase